MPDKTLIVIVGPTAIGKTALAIRIAKHFDTEIISADSRQFYKEMEIGTAKPSLEELREAKHHFVNSHTIDHEFTVGDFEKEAIRKINSLFQAKDLVVMVGGSGLFINAVCDGFDELPKALPETRENLNILYKEQGIEGLQQKLKSADPDYYEEVDINNPQRIIRALEVFETTGKPFSAFRTRNKVKRPFNIIKIGLDTDRTLLYDRINHRVDIMVNSGLLEEVKTLLPFRHLNALNTVGYSELFKYLDGNCSLQEAIEQIKQNTRRFAKRQLTWFRKSEDVTWFKPEQEKEILEHLISSLYRHPGSAE